MGADSGRVEGGDNPLPLGLGQEPLIAELRLEGIVTEGALKPHPIGAGDLLCQCGADVRNRKMLVHPLRVNDIITEAARTAIVVKIEQVATAEGGRAAQEVIDLSGALDDAGGIVEPFRRRRRARTARSLRSPSRYRVLQTCVRRAGRETDRGEILEGARRASGVDCQSEMVRRRAASDDKGSLIVARS